MAVTAFLTGRAVAVMRGEQQLEDDAAVLQKPRAVRADAHTVARFHRAGCVDLAGLFILHHAHTARAVNGKVGVIAECRHFDAGLADHGEHVLFAVEADALSVNDHHSLCHGSILLNGVDRAERARAPARTAVDALFVVDRVRHTDLAGNGLHRAVALALAAALAQLRLDDKAALTAVADRAVVVDNVCEVFLAEVFECAHHRVARRLAETAQRRLGDGAGKLLEQIKILKASLVVHDAREDLEHPLRALPAGHALAAAFILREAHEKACRFHHAGALVHDDETARTDDGADLLERVKVQRQVEVLLGQAAARGAADLHRLEFLAVLDAAADVEDDLAQRRAHRHLDQSRVDHVARQGEGLCAGAFLRADAVEPCTAAQNDLRNIRVGLHIVEHRGPRPQTLLDRARRLDARHTALALDGCGQRAALAADECARAAVDVQMEGKVRAQNVVPEQAQLLIPGDGDAQALDCQRILRADVDVALVAAGGERGDHHALDDRMGVALHDGAVHERAGVALVAVADHILLALGLAADAVPLSARGKARAAAAAQSGIEDLTADVLVGHLKERLFKGGVAVVGKVFVNVLGVRRAAVFQHHALLLGVKGDLIVLGVPHAIELIEQALDRLAAEDGPFNDLIAVLEPDVRVKKALRLDLKQRSHFAEAVAAALFEVDGVVSALMAQRDARFQPALFTLGL